MRYGGGYDTAPLIWTQVHYADARTLIRDDVLF